MGIVRPTQATDQRRISAAAAAEIIPAKIKRLAHSKAAPIDVARYIVWLAAAEEEPDYLTHLRVQKLLYYVQGWSLAVRGKPMFDGRIEAWAHGPVVKELYPILAAHGNNPILPTLIGVAENLTDEERQFIRSVWLAYRGFSASSLREMTHNESPWIDARKGLGPADRCDNEITHQAMKDFFSKASKK
jgi:uncharacterized phage-associated protein